MRRIGDIMFPNGTYTNKDGQEKTNWIRCGSLLEKDGKQKIKLDVIPTEWSGWFEVFSAEPRDNARAKTEAKAAGRDEFEDEVPF